MAALAGRLRGAEEQHALLAQQLRQEEDRGNELSRELDMREVHVSAGTAGGGLRPAVHSPLYVNSCACAC